MRIEHVAVWTRDLERSAHVALRLDSREAVDAMVAELESRGVAILGRPRVTGDGYYEAVLADPEGNRIELVGGKASRP